MHCKKSIFDLNRISVEQFKEAEKLPLVVVLDNVRSMYNVGSVLRTADAFRVNRVYMCGITPRPPHPEIHKTALGAEDSVEWSYVKDTLAAVAELKDKGYNVYAVEQCEGSIMLDCVENLESSGIAIVFGHEVKGVSQEVINQCDQCLEIPQYGTKHSLNVSTTAGIVIWELWKMLHR